jgi:hypothetical protein
MDHEPVEVHLSDLGVSLDQGAHTKQHIFQRADVGRCHGVSMHGLAKQDAEPGSGPRARLPSDVGPSGPIDTRAGVFQLWRPETAAG